MHSGLVKFYFCSDVMITEPEFEEHAENSSTSDVLSNRFSVPFFGGDIDKLNRGLDMSDGGEFDRVRSTFNW